MGLPAPDPDPHAAVLSPEVDLCLELGRSLQRYATPAHRFEGVMARVAARLGRRGQFFAQPTAFFASIEEEGRHRTYLESSPASDVNLERMVQLQAVADGLLKEGWGVEEARRHLREVVESPARFSPLLEVASYGLAVGAAPLFMGGGWREVAVTAAVGLAVGCLGLLMGARPLLGRLLYLVGAFLAALLASFGARLVPGTAPLLVTACALLPLIPGLRLITAMNELATGHLMSGTSRLMDTGMIFLQLSFGVGLGHQLGAGLGAELAVAPRALGGAWPLLGLVLTPVAFVVLFKARPRDLGWIFMGCALAYAGARLGGLAFGREAGVGVGTFLLGAGANLLARLKRIPSAVSILPGLMILVPGSAALRGITAVLQKQMQPGLEAGATVLLVALAMMTGLLLAHALVPSRLEL